jgi:polysaccharide export outer membrane protein
MKILLLSILVAIYFLSCKTPDIGGPPPKSNEFVKKEYVIGPEDILKIYVWKHDGISVTVPVRSDGKISIPLITDIEAAGLTPNVLKNEIAKRLSKYIEQPTVSVIVGQINSQKISISGQVKSPGIYKIYNEINVIEAISLGGGFTDFADTSKVRIIRKYYGSSKIYQINYDAIISGEDINQNIMLCPGDSIIVP